MVGVPFLVKRCDSGPSSRIGWPWPCFLRSQRIIAGPAQKEKIIEVSTAPPVRKVRYLNRLNRANWSARG